MSVLKECLSQGDKMNFSEELYESFEAEGDRLTSEIISNIMSYDGLNIEKIHQILVGNRCPFKRHIHVCVKNNFDEILHVGLQPSKINYDILQEWVDTYYSYKFKSPIEKSFCGFILYLIYVRIHPHQDGNGRTARYLFLENKLLEGTSNYFPLSAILNNAALSRVNDKMATLFSLIDIREKNVSEEAYYTLSLSDKYVKTILYIMYVCISYKHIMINSSLECKIYKEYESFFEMLCHYRNPLIGSTFIEDDMSVVKDVKLFLSNYIDISKHVKVLKVLDV